MKNKFAILETLIGNTPLFKITFKYKGKLLKIFAKAESYNFSGSIKDRIALNILKKAYKAKTIKEGDIITEVTSGNTGISFCALGAYLGHKVVIYMPDWLSKERQGLMKLYGAELRLVSKADGGFRGALKMAEEFSKQGNVFCPLQFDNEDNTDAHFSTTAPEIERQLKEFNIKLDAIIAGVGTGGTVMGLAKYFKPKGIKCHPLEPASSPTLSTGHKVGSHRIEGISDEFIPSIVRLNELDSIIAVDDGDSICMAKKLSAKLGLGVGISSGANFLGALKLILESGNDDYSTVTLFSDNSKKYLSTALCHDECVKDHHLSNDVELVSFEVVK
ncbi:MAG: PLP-dependent cysteine synthase family protein [Firmicutes bacterium]|nr:PLP-dependent cysteine synthase family protein [Bacillota bacterium]